LVGVIHASYFFAAGQVLDGNRPAGEIWAEIEAFLSQPAEPAAATEPAPAVLEAEPAAKPAAEPVAESTEPAPVAVVVEALAAPSNYEAYPSVVLALTPTHTYKSAFQSTTAEPASGPAAAVAEPTHTYTSASTTAEPTEG